MSLETKRRAHIALNRFGLGAKPGGINRIHDRLRVAFRAELERPDAALITSDRLPTYNQACNAIHRNFEAENDLKELELTARINKHLNAEIGFVERLVMFFSNHFSMTINKDGAIRATIGQLERDVIRKHVLGSFKNMLVGVYQHPAMLAYLDNADSIGPNSSAGKAWGVGLNQNLARECLELHTLGVSGGYTEQDIDAMSKVLTGWSFVRGWEAEGRYNGGNKRNRGQFLFRRDWHEPGTQRLLGNGYSNTGLDQGVAVLNALARHRSTAEFLAFKLVRHFITDEPTPDMVEPVALAYRQSGGNLKITAEALLDLPQAWDLPLTKLRTPYELQIAEMRAMNRVYDPRDRWPFYATLGALRHLPWERPAPDGYSDESTYWMGADAMRIRLETAQMNGWTLQQIKPFRETVSNLADSLFDVNLSEASRRAIGAADSKQLALATLFMCPEFQRR